MNRKILPALSLASLLALMASGSANAAVTIGYDAGIHHVVTPAMEEFATSANEMAGMQMTVVQGGVSNVYTWGVLQDDFGNFTRGGVLNDQFEIYATGDTWCFAFCGKWMLRQKSSQRIDKVVFHGATAGIVFDLTTSPGFGTVGSAAGFTFGLMQVQLPPLDMTVTYRNEVSVGSNPVVGDLYTDMELDFGPAGLRGFIQFGADTDRIPGYAAIAPAVGNPSTVNEPGALGLACAALGLLLARRRRSPVRRR